MKRPREDATVKITVNRLHVLLNTTEHEDRARCAAFGSEPWLVTYWALALGGRVAIVEVYSQRVQIRWCREHRDWCDIRAYGPERVVRRSQPVDLMLPGMSGAEMDKLRERFLALPGAEARSTGPFFPVRDKEDAYSVCVVCGHFRKDHSYVGVSRPHVHLDYFACLRAPGCDCAERVLAEAGNI